MITLKNESVTVKIEELGAELKSIRCHDTEYLWEGRKEVWGATSPLLFPICGGLKDDKYRFEGKEYSLPKHGFGRHSLFTVETQSDTSVTLLHLSNAQTLKQYPFQYELRVTYTLSDKSLTVGYEVQNRTNGRMYFSIGAHEGYYTPEGIEDYDVIFPQKETLDAYVLYGNLLSDQRLPIIKDSEVLPLYDKYFTVDALVFKDLKSRSAILRNRKTGKAVEIQFPFADYFLLWHKPNAPYICVEPWAGIQDSVSTSSDITEKEGIISLEKDQCYTGEHRIAILS